MDGDCACGAVACGAGGSFGFDCGSGEGVWGGGGAVQAGCLSFLFDSVAPLATEAGSRPGSRLPFLDSPRKVRSKKATRMSATPSLRCGATCVVAVAGFAVKLSSRCALRSNITASQITKQSCPSAGLQPRNHHAAGADIRGVGAGLRFARPRFEAERSDGAGCWLFVPQPPPFCPTQVARSEAKGRGQFGAVRVKDMGNNSAHRHG